MTPEQLEKAHTLLKRYQYLQTVRTNFAASTGYRLKLVMEFKNKTPLPGSDNHPDLPITKAEIEDLLSTLMTEVYNQLKDLGVEV